MSVHSTIAKAISKAQRSKIIRHYLDSIKAICFTALMGVTTFGFTKVEVIVHVDYDHTINIE